MPRAKAVQDVDRHVARRIRERRLALGLTQKRLAELVGSVYQQVNKYERGVNRVSAGQLHRIAEALGVEPGYFFKSLGVPTRPTARQRRMIELTQSFAVLPRRQQEALCQLARALAEP
jgi:transcriptional regulator with XRE-family HTH domain